ncbi:MAG TPA: ATP-binding cassette domain-containing protein [Candidatus Dormibacteraeota bacterium]|nr:ATP-binding cassette domain-containing protein [Candidatus Dormibacteraeota bacterium]
MLQQAEPVSDSNGYAIETHGLTKKFNDLTAVDHIDLDVRRGEIYGFLGPNGAGKSTTIRMLCTLLRPTSGAATVAGFDIDHDANEVRKRIGLVSEKLIMYTRLTAEQNLNFFGKLYGIDEGELKAKIAELLDMVKLTPFKDRSVGGFSSGMRQRMNVIRALIHDPEIIFLDEPTTALDPQSTKFVRDTIRELKQEGHTIVLTTHIMEEADELSDRISIIDHGTLMATGTVAELKNTHSTESMLEVFLAVTGRELRDSASDHVSMKAVGRM